MPPVIPNGPDLPVELLQAHEKGRLVLFCGAGVSFGAGLPSFQTLVDLTYQEVGYIRQDGEEEAYRSAAYDRVFELLERRIGSEFVRPAVKRILQPAPDVSLETHANLLRLAQDSDGRLRLITTNFDPLFAMAAVEMGLTIDKYSAPFLPHPRPAWNGLVHLHGALNTDDLSAAPDSLSDFVLSSSDFGRAYLTEGWASRYLRELFREFDVLFVGYSVNDPAVRYLMDALSSQRRQGEAFHGAWVLAGVRGGKKAPTDRRRWLELGIEPLFYNQERKHRHLYATLKQWAYLYRGGLLTRAGWATGKYRLPPDSAREDDAKMVIWALSDRTGTAAKAWADADRRDEEAPSEEEAKIAQRWLELFEDSDQAEIGEKRRSLRLLAGITPAEEVQLFLIGGHHEVPRLPPPAFHLARWLVRYLAEEWLIERLVVRRGLVHPQMARLLREEIVKRGDIPGWKRRLLTVLSSADYQAAVARSLTWELRGAKEASPVDRMEIERVLEPIPQFRPASELSRILDGDGPSRPPFESELVLAGGDLDVQDVLEHFADDAGQRRLADYSSSITGLLEGAVEWLNYLEPDQSQAYLSWRAIHSIAEEGRERSGEAEWSELVRLAAKALSALRKTDPDAARFLVARWTRNVHPIFKRLVLHVASEQADLDADLGVVVLLDKERASLWELFLRRERERFLRTAGARLKPKSLRQLVDAILAGPPKHADDAEERSADDAKRARERDVWRLLSKLRVGGAKLEKRAVERLESIEQEFSWKHEENYRDELIVYTEDVEEGVGVSTAEDLRTLTDSICDGRLSATSISWSNIVRKSPVRALSALRRCAQRDRWPGDHWAQFLNNAQFKANDRSVRLRLLAMTWRLLENAPEDTLADLGQSLTWLLSATAKHIPPVCHVQALRSWDRLWPLSAGQPDRIISPTDSFTQALNHSAGQLAQALVGMLNARSPQKGERISPDIRSRMELQLATQCSSGARYARLILAAHLPYLYFVDEDWASRHLVSLFSWDGETAGETALDAWNAFLHRPRFSPDLLEVLRDYFVEAIRRRAELPEQTREVLVGLVGILGVESREWLSDELQTKAVHSFDSAELAELAWRLGNLMKADPTTAAQKWREAVGPWFLRFWPKDKNKRSSTQTDALVALVVAAGDAFEDAAEAVKPFLVAARDSRLTYLLSKGNHEIVVQNPRAVLDLLDRIIPQAKGEAEPWGFHRLSEVLDLIEESDPELAGSGRFRRLREFLLA